MAKNDIYKVTLKNWSEHNPGSKKHYKKTLIPNNFLNDAKLRAVPVAVRWMFLGIVLTCGDHARDTVEISESQLRDMLESSWSIERALASLQHLQILTFVKIDLFINRIEKKRREKKEIEVNEVVAPEPDRPPEPPPLEIRPEILTSRIWESYRRSFLARYGLEPLRNAKVNAQISQLAKRLGGDAPLVVEFYVRHNKIFYVGKTHEIGLCLADAESLHTQWQKGKAITNVELKRFEKAAESASLDRMIEEGKI